MFYLPESGEKISMRELYVEYRAFVVTKGRPRFKHVEDELRLLERYAPVYETLEGRKEHDKTMAWLGRKLAAWQVTTAYPIAFQIAREDVSDDDRAKIAKLIYSFIARRALCDLTAKNLNRVFQAISRIFIVEGASVETLITFFEERSGDSTRFPSDEEFRQGILTQPVYSLAPSVRIKDILWEFELASRTNFSEKLEEMPHGLQTEHVLPVTWTDDWPLPDGDCVALWSDDPIAIERRRLLHTIGNLTLITGGLNSSSGNKGFMAKKEKYAEHTGLFLNKWFDKQSEWNEEKIRERSEYFAEMAANIWVGLNKT